MSDMNIAEPSIADGSRLNEVRSKLAVAPTVCVPYDIAAASAAGPGRRLKPIDCLIIGRVWSFARSGGRAFVATPSQLAAEIGLDPKSGNLSRYLKRLAESGAVTVERNGNRLSIGTTAWRLGCIVEGVPCSGGSCGTEAGKRIASGRGYLTIPVPISGLGVLTPRELLMFGLVYSYSVGKNPGPMKGSNSWAGAHIGIGRTAANSVLGSLVEKGFVTRADAGPGEGPGKKAARRLTPAEYSPDLLSIDRMLRSRG